jgi:hypothetical protein
MVLRTDTAHPQPLFPLPSHLLDWIFLRPTYHPIATVRTRCLLLATNQIYHGGNKEKCVRFRSHSHLHWIWWHSLCQSHTLLPRAQWTVLSYVLVADTGVDSWDGNHAIFKEQQPSQSRESSSWCRCFDKSSHRYDCQVCWVIHPVPRSLSSPTRWIWDYRSA